METLPVKWIRLTRSSVALILLTISIVNPRTINNYHFDNSRRVAYLTLSSYGLLQCGKMCALDGRCVSINYHLVSLTCEMTEVSADLLPDSGEWLSTFDFSFVDLTVHNIVIKGQIDEELLKKGLLGSCANANYTEFGVCVLLRNGGSTTTNKYCPVQSPILNGNVSSDKRTVGENTTYSCNEYYVSDVAHSTCLSNGKWSAENITCIISSNDIRLVGGSTDYEGRIEILYTGVWGTVCDDKWDDEEASVVCSQLGYSGGQATDRAFFGEGSGQIWMDDVECNGDEIMLRNCQFPGWGDQDCSHSEDAGVICSNAGS